MDISGMGIPPQVRGRGSTTKTNAVSSQFDVALHRAASASASQDTVDISSLSYEQKLDIIRKEHEETDYSNMSAVEVGQTVLKRFEDAFPDMWAGFGGLYGPVEFVDLNNQTTNTIYGKIQDEFYAQMDIAVEKSQKPYGQVNLAKDVFGYSGSEQEIQKQIMDEFPGDSMVDRGNAIGKLLILHVGNRPAEGTMMYVMTNKLYDMTKSRFGSVGSHDFNPLRISEMANIASGQAMSWTQLKHTTLSYAALVAAQPDNHAFLGHVQEQLDEFWKAF